MHDARVVHELLDRRADTPQPPDDHQSIPVLIGYVKNRARRVRVAQLQSASRGQSLRLLLQEAGGALHTVGIDAITQSVGLVVTSVITESVPFSEFKLEIQRRLRALDLGTQRVVEQEVASGRLHAHIL